MLTNYYTVPVPNLKKYKLLLLLLVSPLFFYAQSSLTGLWVGSMSSDSTTVRKDQSFEIALTEYKGKVYGYSRSEFIVDDVLYYIVKRVKGTIEENMCEVTDDEIVSYNFPKKLEKNVKVTSTFRRNTTDSIWHLDGKWKTNTTKKYYSVSGRVALESEPDVTASKIFPHLEELKLADDVAFYKERKEGQPIVRIAKPEKADPGFADKTESLSMTKDYVSSNNTITQRIDPTANPIKKEAATTQQTTTVADADINKKTFIEKNDRSKQVTSSSPGDQKNDVAVTNKKDIAVPSVKTNSDKEIVMEKVATTRKENQIKESDVVLAKPVNNKPTTTTANNNPAKNSEIEQEIVAKKETTTSNNKTITTSTTAKTNDKLIAQKNNSADNKSETKAEMVAKNNSVKQNNAITNPQSITIKQTDLSAAKNDTKNTTLQTGVSAPVKMTVAKEEVIAKINVPVQHQQMISNPAIPEIKKSQEDITLKAAIIAGRKSEFSQVVNFKSDSLQIALYDNGEIDGDTVSVFMNGEVILAQQGLKSSAIRKTIYLPSGQADEFTLVMFAESLGKYPPNTGLLVIRDGDDVYNLRFSSDFQKNAGIVFRRKK